MIKESYLWFLKPRPKQLYSLWKRKVLAARSCWTLCDPMDCSPLNSSVHGILQQEYWNGSHLLFQRMFPPQGLNLVYKQILYHLSHHGSPSVVNTSTVCIMCYSLVRITIDSLGKRLLFLVSCVSWQSWNLVAWFRLFSLPFLWSTLSSRAIVVSDFGNIIACPDSFVFIWNMQIWGTT